MGPSLESNGMVIIEIESTEPTRLQWGRRSKATEWSDTEARKLGDAIASMGPSLESNGMRGTAFHMSQHEPGFNGAVARKQRNVH